MFKSNQQSASKKVARTATSRWHPLAKATAMAMIGMLGWTSAQAENLIDLYQAAKQYDAIYLSAMSQVDTKQYMLQQSYALMRPSLGLKASLVRSRFDSSVNPSTPEEEFAARNLTGSTQGTSNTTTRTISLAAKQPLFNRGEQTKIAQAEQAVVAAQADLALAEHDLAARLTQAYFDVLGAQDVLMTTQTNKTGLAEQLASAKRNFEVGNATITDTREAQARYDLASAQEIAATNDLRVKRIALDQLVGRADVKPSPLATPINLDKLTPGEMEDWVSRAATSPTVRKAEVDLTLAKLEIDKARAGQLPVVNAIASLSNTKNETGAATARLSSGTNGSIGVELDMPLFAGGAIQNRIKETLTLQQQAQHAHDKAMRTVSLGTRQAFSAVQSGLALVKAYEAAEVSAKLALEATQLGYRVGVRINKDVLDAQTQVTTMQKDLYKARYDVIVSSIKLKQAAGTLSPDDLTELNKLLMQQ